MTNEQAAQIINATDAGWTVLAVAVPTRALRVIGDDLGLKFRVEQLDPGTGPLNGTYKWRPVSTHAGDESFESFGPAMQDMINKQARLKEKLKLAVHDRNMARIKAENPRGTTH